MKKIILLVLNILFCTTVVASDDFRLNIFRTEWYSTTQLTFCSNKNQSYLLVQNCDGLLNKYLVIKEDTVSISEVYGEFLISYYSIKNAKKIWAEIDGEKYISRIEDNSKNVDRFLYLLTSIDRLNSFKSFNIDNSIRKEHLKFYDAITYSETEELMISSAGYLMSISASDYISYIHNLGKRY